MYLNCIICGESLEFCDKQEVVQKPRKEGLVTLVSAAEKRKDARILANRDMILAGNVQVRFHKLCRKTYTSVQNISFISGPDIAENAGIVSSLPTRKRSKTFDIRSMCLICNKMGKKNRKSLICVQTGKFYGRYTLFKYVIRITIRNWRIDLQENYNCCEIAKRPTNDF